MRTTVEFPDELLSLARRVAASEGISLKDFFIDAVERRLAPEKKKPRLAPPVFGSPDGPRIGVLTAEQIEEAAFGPITPEQMSAVKSK